MKLARIALFVGMAAALAIAGLYVYSRTLPATWHVERARTMAARADDVHAYVATPREWANWAGGAEARKGQMTFATFGPASGVSAGHTWTGPGSHGRMEIASADPEGITYAMTMEDAGTPAQGSIRYSPDADKTLVTWTDEGDFGTLPFGSLFVSMMEEQLGDHMVGALAELDRLSVSHRIARERDEADAIAAQAQRAAEAEAADPGELGTDELPAP